MVSQPVRGDNPQAYFSLWIISHTVRQPVRACVRTCVRVCELNHSHLKLAENIHGYKRKNSYGTDIGLAKSGAYKGEFDYRQRLTYG